MRKLSMTLLIVMTLCLTLSFVMADDTATVVEDKIIINHLTYDNEKSEYPILLFQDIYYMPVTGETGKLLGINKSYSPSTGIALTTGSQTTVSAQSYLTGHHTLGQAVSIKPLDMPISINGIAIVNQWEHHPLFRYNNVVYLPMTKRIALNGLNISTGFVHHSYDDGQEYTIEQNHYTEQQTLTPTQSPLTEEAIETFAKASVTLKAVNYEGYAYYVKGYYVAENQILVSHPLLDYFHTYSIIDGETVIPLETKVLSLASKQRTAILLVDQPSTSFLTVADKTSLHEDDAIYHILLDASGLPVIKSGFLKNSYASGNTTLQSKDLSMGAFISAKGELVGLSEFYDTDDPELYDLNINYFTDLLQEAQQVYDLETNSYLPPFNQPATAPSDYRAEIEYNNPNATLSLSWESTYADYYEVYIALNDGPFESLIHRNKNIWSTNAYYDFEVIDADTDSLSYYVVAVKDGVASEPGEINTIYVKPTASTSVDYLEHLMTTDSIFENSQEDIQISHYLMGSKYDDELYVYAFVQEGTFASAFKNTISDADVLLLNEQLKAKAQTIGNTLNTRVKLYLLYLEEDATYDPSIARFNYWGDIYSLKDNGTYQMLFPLGYAISEHSYEDAESHIWSENYHFEVE